MQGYVFYATKELQSDGGCLSNVERLAKVKCAGWMDRMIQHLHVPAFHVQYASFALRFKDACSLCSPISMAKIISGYMLCTTAILHNFRRILELSRGNMEGTYK